MGGTAGRRRDKERVRCIDGRVPLAALRPPKPALPLPPLISGPGAACLWREIFLGLPPISCGPCPKGMPYFVVLVSPPPSAAPPFKRGQMADLSVGRAEG